VADEILTTTEGRVGYITFNRPEALNALNSALMDKVVAAVQEFDHDPGCGAIVLRGSDRAFAAGADITEMVGQDYQQVLFTDLFGAWDTFAATRTPVIASVAGYALGGGCEVAMMCDIIIAADTAKFGQPEIKLGTIPGIGGTQRLTRAVGKAKAMDLILTGRMMDAHEAEQAGLVARVVDASTLDEVTREAAEQIASYSLPVTFAAKEAVNRTFETTLAEGVKFERRTFQATFALGDRKEGMEAFIDKRAADFTHR
jgi:enoyl-CoA hydratase